MAATVPTDIMETLGNLVNEGDISSQQLAVIASSKADVTGSIVRGIHNMQPPRDSHPDVFAKAVQELLRPTPSWPQRSLPSFLPPANDVPSAVRNPWAVKRNWLPAQIEKALDCVFMCGGNINVSAAARQTLIPRRTLEGWVLKPPKKLTTYSIFRGGHAGPKTAMSAYIEAQLVKLIALANDEGEETCTNWVLSFARDLAERDDFEPSISEGWFYRYRHRALLEGIHIRGRTPSEIFQNVATRQKGAGVNQ
jgi:hypothetical protein